MSLRLGDLAPNFEAQTTQGPMPDFHAWKADQWAILFSHPADFSELRDDLILCSSRVHN